MQSIAIIGLGFSLLAVQSALAQIVPWDMLVPSLGLPVILYMGLSGFNAGHGAILAFAIGYMTDVFAGSPMGLHTMVAVATFLVSRLAALRLFLQGWVFEMVLTFALALFSSILVLLLRALFDKDLSGLLVHLKIVSWRAAATAIAAPLVYRLTGWTAKASPGRRIGEGRATRG